jgi:hypothetical protein
MVRKGSGVKLNVERRTGNTPDVNDEYYYYDNTDINEKRAAIEKVHKKRNFA